MDLRTLCLGVLTSGPATGYEIRKIINTRFAHFAGASVGALYPALNSLLAGKLVQVISEKGGPLDKRVFEITTEGRDSFVDRLTTARGVETVRSEFLAAMNFARFLPLDHIHLLVDRRMSELREELAAMRALPMSRMTEGERFAVRYATAVRRAAIEFMEHEGRAIITAEERANYRQKSDS